MSARLSRAVRGLAIAATTTAVALATLAPAQAEEPTEDRVRQVRVGPASPGSVASPLAVRASVVDKRDDAKGTRSLRRHADVRKASYRTPSTREGGTMTVRVRWRDLLPQVKGRRIRQGVSTFVDLREDRSEPFSYVGYGPLPQFTLYVVTDGRADIVRPEDLRVRAQAGRNRTVVTMSTEWLEAGEVSVFTFSQADGRDFDSAYDSTRAARLRVGPAPAAD